MSRETNGRLNFRVGKTLQQNLEAWCHEHNLTMSESIRVLLSMGLDKASKMDQVVLDTTIHEGIRKGVGIVLHAVRSKLYKLEQAAYKELDNE